MQTKMPPVQQQLPATSLTILKECVGLATSRLPASIKSALDKVDDALFELANRSDSSNRQNVYFDAMRELRLKREDFGAEFLRSFHREFANSLDLGTARRAARAPEVEPELALVERDDVEQSLAVINFAQGLSARCKEEIFGLDKRMGVLLNDPDLKATRNPLGPHAIGDALSAACRQLDADIEIKLTLFKLFERFSGAGIVALYQDINERLVGHAVLPKIKTAVQVPTGGAARRTRITIESESDGTQNSGHDVLGMIQDLMLACDAELAPPQAATKARGPDGGPPRAAAAPLRGVRASERHAAAAAAGSPAGQFVPRLTQLQRGNVAFIDDYRFDPATIAAGNVNVLRSLRTSGAIGDLSQTDGLTLDVVTILFDYILDDPAIPDTFKALIGRLQIPMLKVALIDKGLFSRKSHPARRLLDALAAAAVGWSDDPRQQDALFHEADRAVRRIIDEFDQDVSLFEVVLEEFLEFRTREDAETQQRAQAAADSLHRKERIVLAKMAADDAVRERLANTDVREFVRQFLVDYWRQLLIVTHVEHGADSAQWRDQIKTMEDLLWSVQPKTTVAERAALTACLPKLVKAVRNGMAALDMDPAECGRVLSMLASVHVVSVKQETEATLAERRLRDETAGPAPPVGPRAAPTDDEFIKRGLARLFARGDLAAQDLDVDLSAFCDPTRAADTDADDADDAEIAGFVAQVMALNLGDWVEFRGADGPARRARFTWISPMTGRYLFTTRAGRRAVDTTLNDLAKDFCRGTARKVDSRPDPLFDRAIGDLIEKLEQRAAG